MVLQGKDSGNAIRPKAGGVLVRLRIHNAFQRDVAVFHNNVDGWNRSHGITAQALVVKNRTNKAIVRVVPRVNPQLVEAFMPSRIAINFPQPRSSQ